MLVPLGADGYLVFVGYNLYLIGGGTTIKIVLNFSIFYFFSLALLWGGQRYPSSAVLECYALLCWIFPTPNRMYLQQPPCCLDCLRMIYTMYTYLDIHTPQGM
jgi:hypothetical protein